MGKYKALQHVSYTCRKTGAYLYMLSNFEPVAIQNTRAVEETYTYFQVKRLALIFSAGPRRNLAEKKNIFGN